MKDGVFTSGTKKNLKTHFPHVGVGGLGKTEVHKNGVKDEPFTRSNKKRLNKEINAQKHPTVKKDKVQEALYDEKPFTPSNRARQTDRMEGASPRIKNKKMSNWNKDNNFMSDTTKEDGAVADKESK